MSTILIIDDIATNRDVLVTLLGYYGHRLLEATDGAAGLKVARAESPDLIIADVLMPTMDGYEFVRQLRTERQIASTPVVFYTAHYLEKESRELAASCAVSLIIAKPAEPQEVLRVVDLALGVHPASKHADVPDEFNREHLRLLTDKLAEKAATLRNANLRLSALIELGQDLASEQDLGQLIQGYCNGARKIMGAAVAEVRFTDTRDDRDLKSFFSGIDAAASAQLDSQWADHPVIEHVVRTRTKQWITVDPSGTGEHLKYVSLLAVPVFSGAVTYGWLGLWNKLGGGAFDEDEAKLASTIAAQMAVRYENALLYREVQWANQSLELRVEERTNELAKANAELQRSNSELEQYAYSASHDLQEPLRMINIYSQLLMRRNGGNLEDESETFLRTIEASAQRMQVMVDDLLSYSKLVVNVSDQDVSVVDLSECCARAHANCSIQIEEVNAEVICGALGKVKGRPEQLTQVFQNLISNAIRYRRPDVFPVVRISTKIVETEYVVSVQDNGSGLDMRYADLIFKLFKRLHGRDVPGTGIGLAICKRVVESHGGRIWVDSVLGEGTTFFFTLPAGLDPLFRTD